MICSSSTGNPNTLYYVSLKTESSFVTHVLVERLSLDEEALSQNDLGQRLVVLRTDRGDYQCEEPLDECTIVLMLQRFGTSIVGPIEDRLKAIAQTIDTGNLGRFWERFRYIESVCRKAYLSRRYEVTGQVVVEHPPIAESIRTSSANVDDAVPPPLSAVRNYPKRKTNPVDRYKPRSRSTPKKEIAK